MSRKIILASQFKRDIKKLSLSLASTEWAEALYCLVNDFPLPQRYCDHALTGEWKDYRDCHITPDLVLIYLKKEDFLQLIRLGSHSQLFG